MTRSIKVLVAGLAIVGVAQTAAATEPHLRLNQVLVRYGDLNLESEAGANKLLKRLALAANDVCYLPPPGTPMLRVRDGRMTCREGALQDAVATVDHPVVTALYQSTRSNSSTKVASR